MNTPAEQIMAAVEWEPLPPPAEMESGELYATHEGWLEIGGCRLKCHQLNNGQRIIDAESMCELLGIESFCDELEAAYSAGKLDNFIAKSDAEFERGEALDTLAPPLTETAVQEQD